MRNSLFYKLYLNCFLLIMSVFSPFLSVATAKNISFVTMDWPPFYASNLPHYGFIAEVTKESLQRVGHTMTIKFMPWARALALVEYGEADALLGAYYTPQRERFARYSDSILITEDVFFMKLGSNIPDKFNGLKALKKYRIGILRKASSGKKFDDADFLKKWQVSHTNRT